MATGHIEVTEGTAGKYIASNSITEDAKTKQVQRVVLNDSSGVELTANIGSLTETAPGTDTASSGLNGRLQRIAQRITDLLASVGVTTGAAVITDADGTVQQYLRGLVKFFANALGAGTAAAAHRTTLASDDPAVATLGATNGAAVITDADGTIQQYLRGLVKLFITAGSAFVSSLVAPNANEVRGKSGAITNTTATQVIAAQGASTKIYLTTVIVTNSHATVGTLVTIQDDAGSPVFLCEGYAAPAGGGFVATFPTPVSTTANQKLMAVCGTTGANVYVSAVGFKGT